MSTFDEQLERMITRRLDGELGDAESLELDRRLLKDPDSRRLFEQSEEIDRIVASTLGAEFGTDATIVALPSADVAPIRFAPPARRSWRLGLLVPGAIAAALLAMVAARWQAPTVSVPVEHARAPRAEWNIPQVLASQRDGVQPRVDRNTAVDVIGVVGGDGSLYFIEVDRSRTVTRPSRQETVQLVTGGL